MVDISQTVARLRAEGSDTHDIEAKSAANGVPSSLATTMSAFSNMPGGGELLLGLDERRNFAAVKIDVPMLKKALASIGRQAVNPPVTVEFFEAEFEGETVLIARIPELDISAKPCTVKRTGKAYLRSWDGDFELSQVELQGFLVNRTQPRFDSQAVAGTTQQDLAQDLVAAYISEARATDRGLARLTDDQELLSRTGVITTTGTPTMAGMLAMGTYPQQWFPNYVIQAAASPEPGAPDGTRVGDIARFSGSLPQMIDDALIWVRTHSRHRIVDSPDGRVRDQFDFPPVAVRELLSNALVHRDLGEWAWSRAIELRIGETDLRLTNPGGLYGLSLSRLFDNHVTSARNMTLMRICQYVNLTDGRAVEALGTGMSKIVQSTVGSGLPAPQFFDQSINFTAILNRPPGLGSSISNVKQVVPQKVTGAEQRVLDVLGTSSLQLREVAATLALSDEGVGKHLRRLREKGLVIAEGGVGQRGTTYRRAK
jgi:ATP-dependent DNA helicase RecG